MREGLAGGDVALVVPPELAPVFREIVERRATGEALPRIFELLAPPPPPSIAPPSPVADAQGSAHGSAALEKQVRALSADLDFARQDIAVLSKRRWRRVIAAACVAGLTGFATAATWSWVSDRAQAQRERQLERQLRAAQDIAIEALDRLDRSRITGGGTR